MISVTLLTNYVFYSFADDTNLLYADNNLRSLEITVNEELRSIGNWLMANKLSLNAKKKI